MMRKSSKYASVNSLTELSYSESDNWHIQFSGIALHHISYSRFLDDRHYEPNRL